MFSKKAVYDAQRSGAVKGAKARAPRAERRVTCRACNGKGDFDTGLFQGGRPLISRCEDCNGSGQVTA